MSSNPDIPSHAVIQAGVDHLKDWLAKEPHLPNIEDERWIKTFFFHNKFSVEKTKVKMDAFFLLKNKYPSILKNRDPFANDIKRAKEAIRICPSNKQTKEGLRVIYSSFNPNTELLEVTAFLKRVFMITDMIHFEPSWAFNCIAIADCRNFKYKHFIHLTPGIVPFSEILNNAYSERVKSLHLINASSVVNTLVEFMKNRLPEKLISRIFVHSSASGINLSDFIDEDVLSCDYGGKGPSLDECDDACQKALEKHATWFKEQDEVCSDDHLRKLDARRFEELTGSFRKLQVD